jgi:hypothetical protein
MPSIRRSFPLLLALALPALAQFGNNAQKLRGHGVCSGVTPSANQVLTWNASGSCWGAAALPTLTNTVFGRSGTVTAQSGDYSYSQVSGTPGATLLAHGSGICVAGGVGCTTGTVTLNTTGATLLVIVDVSGSGQNPTGDTVNDGNGNTWQTASGTSYVNSTGVTIWYSYSKGAAALSLSSAETFSVTGSFGAIDVMAFSGTATYPINPYSNQSGASTASSATLQYPSTSCYGSPGLLIAGAGVHSTGTPSIDTGFTLVDQTQFVSGYRTGMAAAYLDQSVIAAVAPIWTQGGASSMAIMLACFSPGAVTAPLTTPSSSSASCTVGQQVWDASYIYVCTAANTWKRAALSSF